GLVAENVTMSVPTSAADGRQLKEPATGLPDAGNAGVKTAANGKPRAFRTTVSPVFASDAKTLNVNIPPTDTGCVVLQTGGTPTGGGGNTGGTQPPAGHGTS